MLIGMNDFRYCGFSVGKYLKDRIKASARKEKKVEKVLNTQRLETWCNSYQHTHIWKKRHGI